MRTRAPLLAGCRATAVAAVVALGLPAQGFHTPVTPGASPGVGPVAVTFTTQSGALSLGNAATAEFTDLAIPGLAPPERTGASPPLASGESSSPGRVIVTFANDDQLISNTTRGQPCNSPLLALMCQLKLTAIGAGGQTMATYVMKGVNIASAASGSPAVITFAYKQIQYTLPTASSGNTTGPGTPPPAGRPPPPRK